MHCSEIVHMQSSFREILEEKLKSPLEEAISPEGKSQFSDPFALSFLMGSIPQFKYQNKGYEQTKAHSFESETKSSLNQKTSQINFTPPPSEPLTQDPSPKETIYFINDLSAEGVAAIYVIKGLGAKLSGEFTFNELKKQYRKLLLRYHPDHCDSINIDPFHDLMQAYESLVSELDGI